MSLILPFDTETTGFPLWSSPSESKEQPHIVQLAAILCDDETQEAIEEIDVIIKPDGWVIPDSVSDIHGITTERAMDEGIQEAEALQMFIELYDKSSLRVAHNTSFDNRIVRIALKRYMPDLITDEVWKDKSSYYCTFNNARKIIGGKGGHTLEEVYFYFTGKELKNAHTAMADTKACMEIYFAIKKQSKL